MYTIWCSKKATLHMSSVRLTAVAHRSLNVISRKRRGVEINLSSSHPHSFHIVSTVLQQSKFLAKRGKYYGPEFRMKIWEYEANKENGQVAFNRRLTRCNGCDGCVDAFYAFWEVATFTVHAPIQCPDTTSLQDPFLYLPTIPVP